MRLGLLALICSLSACVQPLLPDEDPMVVASEPWHCSPTTCAGCCVGDVCRLGDTKPACGNGGNACRTCADDQRCMSGGECVPNTGSVPVDPANPISSEYQQSGKLGSCPKVNGVPSC